MRLINRIKEYIENKNKTEVEYDTSIMLNDKFVNNDDSAGMVYDLIVQELKNYEQDFNALKNKTALEHRKKEVEDKILKLIEENDNVLAIQDLETELNIGMIAASLKLENIVLRALDNPVASTQQDKDRKNLGTLSAFYKLENATMKALDNHEASLQCDEFGMNMGMYAANCGFEKCVLKALDNKEACRQTDIWGDNLGMYCARERFNDATLKALDDEEMSTHINGTGSSMAYIISMYGMRECLKKIIIKYPETLETFSVGCSKQMRQDIQEIKAEIEQDRLKEENIENSAELEMENESD